MREGRQGEKERIHYVDSDAFIERGRFGVGKVEGEGIRNSDFSVLCRGCLIDIQVELPTSNVGTYIGQSYIKPPHRHLAVFISNQSMVDFSSGIGTDSWVHEYFSA